MKHKPIFSGEQDLTKMGRVATMITPQVQVRNTELLLMEQTNGFGRYSQIFGSTARNSELQSGVSCLQSGVQEKPGLTQEEVQKLVRSEIQKSVEEVRKALVQQISGQSQEGKKFQEFQTQLNQRLQSELEYLFAEIKNLKIKFEEQSNQSYQRNLFTEKQISDLSSANEAAVSQIVELSGQQLSLTEQLSQLKDQVEELRSQQRKGNPDFVSFQNFGDFTNPPETQQVNKASLEAEGEKKLRFPEDVHPPEKQDQRIILSNLIAQILEKNNLHCENVESIDFSSNSSLNRTGDDRVSLSLEEPPKISKRPMNPLAPLERITEDLTNEQFAALTPVGSETLARFENLSRLLTDRSQCLSAREDPEQGTHRFSVQKPVSESVPQKEIQDDEIFDKENFQDQKPCEIENFGSPSYKNLFRKERPSNSNESPYSAGLPAPQTFEQFRSANFDCVTGEEQEAQFQRDNQGADEGIRNLAENFEESQRFQFAQTYSSQKKIQQGHMTPHSARYSSHEKQSDFNINFDLSSEKRETQDPRSLELGKTPLAPIIVQNFTEEPQVNGFQLRGEQPEIQKSYEVFEKEGQVNTQIQEMIISQLHQPFSAAGEETKGSLDYEYKKSPNKRGSLKSSQHVTPSSHQRTGGSRGQFSGEKENKSSLPATQVPNVDSEPLRRDPDREKDQTSEDQAIYQPEQYIPTDHSDLVEFGTRRGNNFESFKEREEAFQMIEQQIKEEDSESNNIQENPSFVILQEAAYHGQQEGFALENQSVDFDDEQMASSNLADSQFMRRSAVSQKCQIEKLEPKFKRDVCFSEQRLSMERSQNLYLEEDPERQRVSVKNLDENGEEEIIYQLDEDGLLMDEQGNYILDEQGNAIRLSHEQIEYLRNSNMLEEEGKN